MQDKPIIRLDGGQRGQMQRATYFAWQSMIMRCRNPKNRMWKNYGGRGIAVCERWSSQNGFANFLEDMGLRPANPEEWRGVRSYWSLDRRDNDGPYSLENCRWATLIQQRNNRRTQRLCKRGHLLTGANVYLWHGHQHCRACGAAYARERRKAHK